MYTKGEWKVEHLLVTGQPVIYANGELIAGGLTEANACLIAQAPKLYEALSRLLDIEFDTEDENYEQLSPILEDAREAIASVEEK